MIARVAALALGLAACGDAGAVLAGGDTTVFDRTSNAYALPAPGLDDAALALHLAGDASFEATFVRGPAPVNAGLGPLYNHNACAACHGRDGRGLPQFGGAASQALVRVSLAHGEPELPGAPVPVPGLGGQLQDHGVFGVPPEIAIELTWIDEPGRYGDGAEFWLRRPRLILRRPDGALLPADVLRSFRQAPAVFGLGLLEAIPDDDLRAAADPDDRDGDGISGRVNLVWDVDAGAVRIGRFGHKAGNPTLVQQAAAAYANDMGVTSRRFGGEVEVTDDVIAAAAHYTATLGVPARAPGDVAAGEALFAALGCDACHTATQRSGDHAIAALAHQTFAPYTDLLLHDLGAGLADDRPEFAADGREWRTPPLWGLGLAPTVLPGASYLHDGRARTVAEAILWHGGEAEPARERFRTASVAQRTALLRFLAAL
ncbi:MAG: thiol oxidoreductase [Myxococcales bacterium]|nr:thiol oxidoreductase [Myxococcales bacterium]